jgi:hypothetical protein
VRRDLRLRLAAAPSPLRSRVVMTAECRTGSSARPIAGACSTPAGVAPTQWPSHHSPEAGIETLRGGRVRSRGSAQRRRISTVSCSSYPRKEEPEARPAVRRHHFLVAMSAGDASHDAPPASVSLATRTPSTASPSAATLSLSGAARILRSRPRSSAAAHGRRSPSTGRRAHVHGPRRSRARRGE